jgi:hypothetical protein
MIASLIIPAVIFIKTQDIHNTKNEWRTIFLVFSNFSLLNYLFITFNYTLATRDSFTLLRLGRSIAFDGFNQNALDTFSKWGAFIPILQSVSLSLHFDYLVSLQFSFAFSFILVFFYLTRRLCLSLTNNQMISTWVTIAASLVLLSTPLYIVQMFFIQGTLTTSIFLFLGTICAWLAISEKNNYWFVFFPLSLIGVSFSRSETFTYSVLLILIFLSTKKIQYKIQLWTFLPYLGVLFFWFLYLSFGMKNGSDSLTPERLPIILLFLALLIIIILLSNKPLFTDYLLPFANKFLLFPLILGFILETFINPGLMWASLFSFLSNLFLTGYWGFSFWIIIPFTIINLFKSDHSSIQKLLSSILVCIVLMVLDMVILRTPYHLFWTDSANRLMTLCLPIGLCLISINLSKWVTISASSPNQKEISLNSDDH